MKGFKNLVIGLGIILLIIILKQLSAYSYEKK